MIVPFEIVKAGLHWSRKMSKQNAAVRVDIWMINARGEVDLRRLEG